MMLVVASGLFAAVFALTYKAYGEATGQSFAEADFFVESVPVNQPFTGK